MLDDPEDAWRPKKNMACRRWWREAGDDHLWWIIYIYTHIHTYTYMHACMHTCMHACMHTYIHIIWYDMIWYDMCIYIYHNYIYIIMIYIWVKFFNSALRPEFGLVQCRFLLLQALFLLLKFDHVNFWWIAILKNQTLLSASRTTFLFTLGILCRCLVMDQYTYKYHF